MISKEKLDQTINLCLKKIDGNLSEFRTRYPIAASVGNIYPSQNNEGDWVQGFWTGELWLAYELTGDDKYLLIAREQQKSYKKRIEEHLGTDTHDLGFLYTLSCVSDYKITGNEVAKTTAIKAADQLIARYKEKGEFIQAWGDINNPENYRLIIDCYMNLPLLYWATEVTGDPKYKTIATNHANTTRSVIIREDNSTFHTYYFDPETGLPTKGVTAQGFSDNSCWSRGQAWGVYGFPLCIKHTGDNSFEKEFYQVTNYFIDHLPSDNIAYWDFEFMEGDEPRDSSASAIAVCGLLEMSQQVKDKAESLRLKEIANDMLESLIDHYTSFELEHANGLLLHGVYSKPGNRGVDEMQIWGDYYFLEALTRLKIEWNSYW